VADVTWVTMQTMNATSTTIDTIDNLARAFRAPTVCGCKAASADGPILRPVEVVQPRERTDERA